jgi:tRNA(Ile)-lysidine synthase TilS/MesJ
MRAMRDLHGVPVIVALSGGVDSAVAALRLVQAGAAVQALYMENWDAADEYCTSAQDYQDARAVARELGIVLHRVNFTAAYRERVFADFLAAYRAGRTPNPDVLCNREIKFGVCLHYAQRLGARWFATGHYAQLEQEAGGPVLLRGADAGKDQSYFLCGVERARFAHVRFPIGSLTKAEVRAQAQRAGLPVFNKPDSTPPTCPRIRARLNPPTAAGSARTAACTSTRSASAAASRLAACGAGAATHGMSRTRTPAATCWSWWRRAIADRSPPRRCAPAWSIGWSSRPPRRSWRA